MKIVYHLYFKLFLLSLSATVCLSYIASPVKHNSPTNGATCLKTLIIEAETSCHTKQQ